MLWRCLHPPSRPVADRESTRDEVAPPASPLPAACVLAACDTTSRIVTITDAWTATDTTTAGVRWRGWLSTHSFDARRCPSVGDLKELLQGALGTLPSVCAPSGCRAWAGAIAVERDDVPSECDRCAVELAIRQLLEQLGIGLVGQRGNRRNGWDDRCRSWYCGSRTADRAGP